MKRTSLFHSLNVLFVSFSLISSDGLIYAPKIISLPPAADAARTKSARNAALFNQAAADSSFVRSELRRISSIVEEHKGLEPSLLNRTIDEQLKTAPVLRAKPNPARSGRELIDRVLTNAIDPLGARKRLEDPGIIVPGAKLRSEIRRNPIVAPIATVEVDAIIHFAENHPLLASAVVLAAGITLFFLTWRYLFPKSWYYFQVKRILKGYSTVGNNLSGEALYLRSFGDKVIDPLIQLLFSSDERLRRDAAYVLGRIGNENSIPKLIHLLSGSSGAVPLAIEALAYIGDKRAVQPIMNKLADPSPSIRLAASKALGDLKDLEASAVLFERLTADEDAKVRRTAAFALGELEDQKTWNHFREISRQDVPAFDPSTFQDYLEGISISIGYIGYFDRIKSFLEILNRRRTDDEQAVQALIRMASNHPSYSSEHEKLLGTIIVFLGMLKNKKAFPFLIPYLSYNSWYVDFPVLTERALRKIGMKNDELADALLQNLIQGKGDRAQTIRSLVRFKHKPAVPELVHLLSSESSESEMKSLAAWGLGELGDSVAIPALEQALVSTPSTVTSERWFPTVFYYSIEGYTVSETKLNPIYEAIQQALTRLRSGSDRDPHDRATPLGPDGLRSEVRNVSQGRALRLRLKLQGKNLFPLSHGIHTNWDFAEYGLNLKDAETREAFKQLLQAAGFSSVKKVYTPRVILAGKREGKSYAGVVPTALVFAEAPNTPNLSSAGPKVIDFSHGRLPFWGAWLSLEYQGALLLNGRLKRGLNFSVGRDVKSFPAETAIDRIEGGFLVTVKPSRSEARADEDVERGLLGLPPLSAESPFNLNRNEEFRSEVRPAETKGTLVIRGTHLENLKQEQKKELFAALYENRSELRLVVVGKRPEAGKEQALAAILNELQNVRFVEAGTSYEAAAKQLGIPGSTEIFLLRPGEILRQQGKPLIFRLLGREGEIELVKRAAKNNGKVPGVSVENGILNPSQAILASLARAKQNKVVAFSA